MKATPGRLLASLTAVDGTVTTFDSHKAVPDGTILRLWGADGNSVVVSRQGDDYWGLSWANVLAANAAPE